MLNRLRGRARRKPLLWGVLVVAVVSGFLVFALGARPGLEVLNAVPVERGFVGTTYAFDELLCVSTRVSSATVTGVEIEQADGSTTRLVRPPAGSPPTVGFPAPDQGTPVAGFTVAAGESGCGLRLLVTPLRTGVVLPGTVRLRLTYGPGGVLPRTLVLTPPITITVIGTGPDPRSAP